MPTYYSDNFNRADGPLGSNWILDNTSPVQKPTISSSAVIGNFTGGNFSEAAWYQQFGPSQSCQILVSSITAPQSAARAAIGLACRASRTDFSGYHAPSALYLLIITTSSGSYILINGGAGGAPGVSLYYDPAMAGSDLSASSVRLAYDASVFITQGDIWKLECVGSNINVYRNGAVFFSISDSSLIASGYTGFGVSEDEDALGVGSPSVDNWVGIDMSAIIVGWEQGGNVQIIEREGMLTG